MGGSPSHKAFAAPQCPHGQYNAGKIRGRALGGRWCRRAGRGRTGGEVVIVRQIALSTVLCRLKRAGNTRQNQFPLVGNKPGKLSILGPRTPVQRVASQKSSANRVHPFHAICMDSSPSFCAIFRQLALCKNTSLYL